MAIRGRKLRQYAPPTEKQLDVWDALDRLTITELMPPSIIDLMVECGMTSKSAVLARLKRGVDESRVATISTRGGTKYVPAWWRRMIINETNNYYEEKNEKYRRHSSNLKSRGVHGEDRDKGTGG